MPNKENYVEKKIFIQGEARYPKYINVFGEMRLRAGEYLKFLVLAAESQVTGTTVSCLVFITLLAGPAKMRAELSYIQYMKCSRPIGKECSLPKILEKV